MDVVSSHGDFLTKEETEAFVGKNSSFYLGKWDAHTHSTLKGWNWVAMFFSMEWMAYRKMYLEAVLFFLFVVLLTIGAAILFGLIGLGLPGDLVSGSLRILAGIGGNALYRKKALRTLRKTNGRKEHEKMQYLKEKGGVSLLGLVVCILIQLAYAILSF